MDPEPSPRPGPRSTLSTLLEDLNRFFRSEQWSEDTVTSTRSATKLNLTAWGAQNVGTQTRRHVTDPAWLVGVEGDSPHLQQTSVSPLSVGHWHCYSLLQLQNEPMSWTFNACRPSDKFRQTTISSAGNRLNYVAKKMSGCGGVMVEGQLCNVYPVNPCPRRSHHDPSHRISPVISTTPSYHLICKPWSDVAVYEMGLTVVLSPGSSGGRNERSKVLDLLQQHLWRWNVLNVLNVSAILDQSNQAWRFWIQDINTCVNVTKMQLS